MKALNPITFLLEVRSELLKVKWPNRQETIKLTSTVIVISAVVGIFIAGLDAGFVKLTTLLLAK